MSGDRHSLHRAPKFERETLPSDSPGLSGELREALDLIGRVRALVAAENRRIREARLTGKDVMDCGSRDEADMLQADLYEAWPAKRLDALIRALTKTTEPGTTSVG